MTGARQFTITRRFLGDALWARAHPARRLSTAFSYDVALAKLAGIYVEKMEIETNIPVDLADALNAVAARVASYDRLSTWTRRRSLPTTRFARTDQRGTAS